MEKCEIYRAWKGHSGEKRIAYYSIDKELKEQFCIMVNPLCMIYINGMCTGITTASEHLARFRLSNADTVEYIPVEPRRD
jgi:hypothetical protein